jgi:hypothetical protein
MKVTASVELGHFGVNPPLRAYAPGVETVVVERQPEYLGLLAAGYVMAFVLPIGGIVVAFALSERRLGHAVAIVMLSVFMTFAWLLLLLAL